MTGCCVSHRLEQGKRKQGSLLGSFCQNPDQRGWCMWPGVVVPVVEMAGSGCICKLKFSALSGGAFSFRRGQPGPLFTGPQGLNELHSVIQALFSCCPPYVRHRPRNCRYTREQNNSSFHGKIKQTKYEILGAPG